MIIDRKIEKYIVFNEDSILHGLRKIDANNMKVAFVVNEAGILEGILGDGDFRRWVVKQNQVDLNVSVSLVANADFAYCLENEIPEKIEELFSHRIEYVPLVDNRMRLVAVACRRKPAITIGNHVIAEDKPVFIIAEIGNNHNGSLELAKKLVDGASDAGVDCVKFQMRNLATLYRNQGDANDAKEDLGSQYVLDLLSKFQLSDSELFEIFDYCRLRNVVPLCTPWDVSSVEFLEQYGIEGYKIASADFTNHDLLAAIAATGKPMLCSTGMSTESEIVRGVQFLKKVGAQFILLHCNSTYPSPFKDINLNYLKRLKEIADAPVGYSGHERGLHVAISAVSMGARVIEKHLTLDRSMEGNDHKVSLLPEEFKIMVEGIRQVEQALGSDDPRTITQGELINRESLAKSLVINRDLEAGEIITASMVEVKSPGKGLAPYLKHEIIGLKAPRDYLKGDFFYPEDLETDRVRPRDFKFTNPYGVPVRYHDARRIADLCKMDLLEIHLSYKDLDENIDEFFQSSFPHTLVVHSPELFSGDHILDLCSEDHSYRNRSVQELQRVIDITRELKTYFPNTLKPPIVVNVGGFSADRFISAEARKEKYLILADSLKRMDKAGVEIIPQTMPPFPWHFGGQRYHNLFVDLQEILEFCRGNDYRICLDISHSQLACNHTKTNFLKFLEAVSDVTAHLHIADAKGIDGEGLQIGEGVIDFSLIMSKISEWMPDVSFIPEIWQGHKNDGQGFWVALDRLEKCLLP